MKKTKHYKGHRWTKEEIKSLVDAWQNKPELTTKEIADSLNVTHYAVLSQVARMRSQGVRLLKRRSGNSAERKSELWTKGEIDYLIRRRNEKATNEQISNELGRTWNAVQAMIYKLRSEGVEVQMRGNGVRRLWDVEEAKVLAEIQPRQYIDVKRI